MEQLQKLQYLSLVSKLTTELENHLGIADKTLAEFIVELSKGKNSSKEFRLVLRENGADMPDSLVETLWAIIQKMAPGRGGGGGGGGGAKLQPREDAGPYKGLALPDTRDRVKEMEEEMLAEARAKAEQSAAAERQRSHEQASTRDGRGGRDYRDGRDRDGRRRSRSRSRSRERRRDRSRSRDRDRGDRNGGGRRGRSRSGSPRGRGGPPPPMPDEPEMYGVYRGRVNNVMDFGCFVELMGFRTKQEGLVHLSNISSTKRGGSAKELVNKGDQVWVKVVSKTGQRLGLAMRDVDQVTGEDMLPMQRQAAGGASNPAGPVSGANVTALHGLSGIKVKEEDELGGKPKRRGKVMSDYEKWEIAQLIKSGVLDPSEYPGWDEEEGGALANVDAEVEEEFEIDLNDAEPDFLRGQTTKTGVEMSPIKIVKNPDGSMQRAAMTQSALAKERRELREQQNRMLLEAIPKDLSKPWEDPLADPSERALAQELRGIGVVAQEVPEWKQQALGKAPTFGIRDNRSIKDQRESLPIFKLREQLIQAVHDNQVLVVIGETGSGKTTQMTQYLAESGYTSKGKIGCTQPRRVAAMSVAKRVSEEVGCRLGEEVGYAIRFEDCTSQQTVIKYMTDGMLLREALLDDMLSQYSVIILDEAHERTIHTDVLFGLLKAVIQKRKDLKVIVTSATLDAEKFSGYFFSSPIFTIPGRTYPVEVLYTKEPESDYMDAALITVMQIHLTEPEGDILLFLTGQEEIDTAAQILFERMKSLGPAVPELIILPVYSALPSEMQTRIFEPAPPGTRKCVIATNIAEASLTIDGIYYVVDPGFAKQKVFNPKIGMDALVVAPISQASARQRAGRAGRTGPGKCYRLYTEAAYKNEMLPTSIPEIQRSNLAMTVLTMKAMGINDLLNFDFMDPPPPQTLISALEQLYNLGALDEEGLLTRLGRKMAEFPLDPPVSKMLIASVDLGCSEEVLTIIGMLSAQNIFYRPKEKQAQADQKKAKFHQPEGDHLTLLAVYEGWKNSKFSNPWCYENFVQARSLRRAQDVRKQLVAIMDRYKLDLVSAGRNYQKIQKAICSGFFFHAARKDAQEGYKTVVEGQPVFIHPSSAIFQHQPQWVVYHELVLTTKEYMREVCEIDPKWLVEMAPRFFKPADPHKLSRRKRHERIEPLYDRFNDPNEWRLSKRRG
ncbi:putative pre-mRNA-splicing factor ATP-dependent RNA helicase [Chlorella sorokiniana]|uniref:RNA helicase n=1 Tax=Chlorella sorokiniana TaxID=3076 RepID=A0A2P6TWD5_CHLSO|nr:putative pre-mRNA-splicing factor ATP-dependent RNA helicase [Chlorella sorokiniana]|eukprot:PRW58375.1 putative pre-mRNA-splicing factor ATP-dependent RNA helicase [Chlorella sorokiniana]